MANGVAFLTPGQVLEAEQQARSQQFAQGAPGLNPAVAGSLGNLGRALSGAFGQAIGGPGIPESPEVQLAKSRLEATKMIDPTNPETYRSAASALYKAGDLAGATTILSQMPSGAEGFTLSPGAKRFTASGEVVAENPKGEDQAKAPTMRTIREGKEMVNQEWNPQTRQWMEVGRGPVGGGMQVSISNVEDRWKNIHDRYQKELKPITEERADIEKIKIAVKTPGGASPQALQTSIANLFGGQSRAIAELERWGNFGNLPERVTNSVSRFFKGDYSEEAKADVMRLLRNYEATGLNKKHEQINERFGKVANAAKVPKDFYEIGIPSVRMLDFSKMSIDDIANIDPTSLELDERKALEDELNARGL